MTKLEKLRSRYIQDPVPVRLGGLAANLARLWLVSQSMLAIRRLSPVFYKKANGL